MHTRAHTHTKALAFSAFCSFYDLKDKAIFRQAVKVKHSIKEPQRIISWNTLKGTSLMYIGISNLTV